MYKVGKEQISLIKIKNNKGGERWGKTSGLYMCILILISTYTQKIAPSFAGSIQSILLSSNK